MTLKSDVRPEYMTHSALLDYCHTLEARLDALNVDASAEAASNLAKAFRLTGKEADLLVALSDGRPHSKDGLLTLLYGGLDEPIIKILDVFVCKARKKLAGSGIEIGTLWGRGYVVEDTAPLLAVMRGEAPRRDAPSTEPSVGKPLSGQGAAYGSVRDTVLGWLREQAVDGKVKTTSSAVAAGTGLPISGSTVLRNLEKGGHLKVMRAPRAGGRQSDRSWVVKLAA